LPWATSLGVKKNIMFSSRDLSAKPMPVAIPATIKAISASLFLRAGFIIPGLITSYQLSEYLPVLAFR